MWIRCQNWLLFSSYPLLLEEQAHYIKGLASIHQKSFLMRIG